MSEPSYDHLLYERAGPVTIISPGESVCRAISADSGKYIDG